MPTALTTLIGRDLDVAALVDLLRDSDTRLVTLTGPGGVGKTRLALEVALQLATAFPDGAHFVPLASVTDPALVAATIAHSLGIQERVDRPVAETVITALAPWESLIVLDNFEQVDAAAPLVLDLLQAGHGLKFLVTSRSLLRLTAERHFPVAPLAFPDPLDLPPLAELALVPAVRLFVERAHAATGDFALTEANAAAVASISRRLDGLPLAIELAASLTRILSPEALLERLTHQLLALPAGPRDLPARQQTIRAAIAWSYELLSPEVQTLFARLGIFAGGWTFEAAEAVAAGAGIDVFAGLSALIDQSLIQRVSGPGGEPRFTMLETIREFAAEQLTARGEHHATELRHGAHFLALAERAKTKIDGAEQAVWLARLDAEQDNLRAVLDRAIARGDAETALRLGSAIWRFWRQRGQLREGRAVLERAVALDADVDPAVRAAAIYYLGNLALDMIEWPAANRYLTESLTLWRQLGNQDGIASSLNSLGLVASNMGDYAAAAAQYSEALAIWTALEDWPGVAMAEHNLGRLALAEEKYAEARDHHERALAWRRQLGNADGVAYSYWALAITALHEGNTAGAESLLQECLAIFRDVGDRQGEAYVLHGLARAARARGADGDALALFHKSLSLRKSIGERNEIVESLEEIAGIIVRRSQPARAVRLLGAADGLRETMGLAPWPIERRQRQQTLTAARRALAPLEFDTAWRIGRSLTFDQALAETLAVTDEARPVPPAAIAFDLTRREREVLALLGQRLTDPEIAAELFISTKTVSNHVSNILAKLGASNRREAAVIAAEHSLL